MKKIETPYETYKKSANWKIVKKGVADLIKNNDLKLLTHEDYVIGYLCKMLEKKA
jgi:hypothetical protein